MTNREWLESLSDEELLNRIYISCLTINDHPDCPRELSCRGCQLKWLNAEHKEVQNETKRNSKKANN